MPLPAGDLGYTAAEGLNERGSEEDEEERRKKDAAPQRKQSSEWRLGEAAEWLISGTSWRRHLAVFKKADVKVSFLRQRRPSNLPFISIHGSEESDKYAVYIRVTRSRSSLFFFLQCQQCNEKVINDRKKSSWER